MTTAADRRVLARSARSSGSLRGWRIEILEPNEAGSGVVLGASRR